MVAELQVGRAGENAHWYTKTGEAAYEVAKAKGGGFRPTTLRDARKLDLLPSVTSIMSIKAKPQLTNWQIRQAVLSALTLPRPGHDTAKFASLLHQVYELWQADADPDECGDICKQVIAALSEEGESDEQFLSRVEQDRQEQARAAAEEGTRIHAAIEQHLLGQPYDAAYTAHVKGTMDALAGIDSEAQWRPEKSFGCAYGYGGKVDLHATETARHPDGVVCDFKTKDFRDGDKLKPYEDWGIQLSAYAYGLGVPDADRYSVVVSRDNPGLVWVHAWDRGSAENHWGQFLCMLALWRLDRRYYP